MILFFVRFQLIHSFVQIVQDTGEMNIAFLGSTVFWRESYKAKDRGEVGKTTRGKHGFKNGKLSSDIRF